MSPRSEATEAALRSPRPGRAPAARPAARPLGRDDERLNDEIHALLRDGAEHRERRTRAEAAEDTAAARRQFDAVVALARVRAGKPRG